MRISSNQIFDRAVSRMLTQQIRTSNLEGKLASGIRVESAADDPIASSQIELILQRIAMTEGLQKNTQDATSIMNIEDSVLANTITTLQRLRELQVQAGNSNLAEADRKIISVEARSLLNQLQDLANTRDSNGYYMFSGGQAATQPFTVDSAGQYIYNGDSTLRYQAVSGSFQIAINDPGDDLFMRIPSGNGYFAIQQTTTPNTGTASVDTGSVTNPQAYIPDDYTMNFALNSQGNLVVMVSGAASGNVIPPSGLPDDAPLFQEGSVVTFNGLQMTVSGQPNPGDAFSIIPSQNESMFSTVQRMVTNLNLPFSSASEKAVTVTENNQLLAQLDSAIASIINTQASLGARVRQIDLAEENNASMLLVSNEVLKNLREIDPIAVAADFRTQVENLQIAQKSFTLIQNLSVFNFI